MLAPKGPTFNGRPTFENPMYLKKAQSEKPCLYDIPYDQSDPTNRLVPDREETTTLEKKSRLKLNKDLVRPYDYTKLNSLYEIFKPVSQEYHEQLAHANEARKKMWRKSFVKSKPNIFKNIELVDQAWEKHSHNHFRALNALDMDVLIKTCLMPLAIKTHNGSFAFVHELKQEMDADLKYLYDLDAHAELQCLYVHKVKECECLAQKISKQTESREQYFEIQYLKAQLQDKDLAISELNKLIEKNKGKGVDTNFEKQSILGKPLLQPIKNQPVVRQPTAYKSERSQLPRHRIASQVGVSHDLTKPVTPRSWPQVRKSSFAKPYDVNAPGPSRNSPKHVSFQTPRETVGLNDMVHN
ncbi:hypothetical protein Tco_0287059 [Tanacetum coccineum]